MPNNPEISLEKSFETTPAGPSTIVRVINGLMDYEPEKIILFGSAARGEMGRNSDVDLLIIKEGEDELDLMARIYRNLRGVGAAVDAIVVSPEDVERYRDSHALIIKPALREGRVVYESSRTLSS